MTTLIRLALLQYRLSMLLLSSRLSSGFSHPTYSARGHSLKVAVRTGMPRGIVRGWSCRTHRRWCSSACGLWARHRKIESVRDCSSWYCSRLHLPELASTVLRAITFATSEHERAAKNLNSLFLDCFDKRVAYLPGSAINRTPGAGKHSRIADRTTAAICRVFKKVTFFRSSRHLSCVVQWYWVFYTSHMVPFRKRRTICLQEIRHQHPRFPSCDQVDGRYRRGS